jgi:hypothetical protein
LAVVWSEWSNIGDEREKQSPNPVLDEPAKPMVILMIPQARYKILHGNEHYQEISKTRSHSPHCNADGPVLDQFVA